MLKSGQVLSTECENYLFLKKRRVKNPNFVTSNVYANAPNQ